MTPDGKFTTDVSSLQDAILGGSVVNNNESLSGNYRINGHTITLTSNNGESVSYIFATNGSSSMIMGRDYYFNLEE